MTTTIDNTVTVAVTLENGGFDNSLFITREGAIIPGGYGVTGLYATVPGDVTNLGNIEGANGEFIIYGATSIASGDGVLIDGSTFQNIGIIRGGTNGADDTGGLGVAIVSGSFINQGSVTGGSYGTGYTGSKLSGSTGASGICLSGGSVVNSGLVSGGSGANYGGSGAPGGAGIEISGGTSTNSGTVVGGDGSGFWSEDPGGPGVSLNGGILINYGQVTGGIGGTGRNLYTARGGVGVLLESGTVLNQGIINGGSGGGDGVDISGGVFFNDGTVSGQNGNASQIKGSAGGDGIYLNNATLYTSGVITGGQGGEIDGTGAGQSFASYGDAIRFGSLAATLAVDVGATFMGRVAGNLSAKDTLELMPDDGTIGTLDLGSSFSGFSNITFDPDAVWTLSGTTMELATGQTINGFTSSDKLVLEGFAAQSHNDIPGAGLELLSNGTIETLDIDVGFSNSSFVVTEMGNNTEIYLLCYLKGTRIATPAGEIAVEDLAIDDPVITRFNGCRRVKWIGRQSFSARFIRKNRNQIPVCIRAGALGPHLPKRDLFVSPGHSMLIGDSLILAHCLVNGVTITQKETLEDIHYYQLEFETHDCVLAEGAWSESFCDYAGLRNQFHNVAEFHTLYPDHVTPDEHMMCAPRPEAGLALAAALGSIVGHAAAVTSIGPLRGWIDAVQTTGIVTGWAQDVANPELPVLLEVLVRNRVLGTILACDYRPDLVVANIAQGRCAFNFQGPRMSRRFLSNVRVRSVLVGVELQMTQHCLVGIDSYLTPKLKNA